MHKTMTGNDDKCKRRIADFIYTIIQSYPFC